MACLAPFRPAFIEVVASPQMAATDRQDFGPEDDPLLVLNALREYCDEKPPGEFENRGSLAGGAGWQFLCTARNMWELSDPPPEVPPPGIGHIIAPTVLEIDGNNPPLAPGCCDGYSLQVKRPTGTWWTFAIQGTQATTVTIIPDAWSAYSWRSVTYQDADPRFYPIDFYSPALALDPAASVDYQFVSPEGSVVSGVAPTDGCALVFMEAIEGLLGQGTPESIAEIEITALHEFVHGFSLNGSAEPIPGRQLERHLAHRCGWPSLLGLHSCAMNYHHEIFTFGSGFALVEQQPELCASHIIALRLSDGLGGLNYVP
jgi:hypothetical protein